MAASRHPILVKEVAARNDWVVRPSEAMVGVDGRPKELLIKTDQDQGDRVHLSVIDAGVGFTPETADKLFEAFYTTKTDGMGIGLSVSRSIIERHRGRLWAEPNAGPFRWM